MSDDCSTVIISYAETAVASILTFLQSRISPASQVTCKLTAYMTISCLKQWSRLRPNSITPEAGRRSAASWNLAYHLAC